MSSPSKRRDSDIMKLMMSGHEVHMTDDATASDFYVKLQGPKDSHYEGGFYRVHVTLPATYPYKSPSIGFCTPIFHPNVDEASGSVCLDVINQTWSPMFDLVNVFNVFLPQLLLYPNPADPLNRLAAQLLMKDPKTYQQRVHEHVQLHASKDFKMNADDEEDEGEGVEEGQGDTGVDGEGGRDSGGEEGGSAGGDEGMEDEEGEVNADEEDEVLSDCDDLPTDDPADQLEL